MELIAIPSMKMIQVKIFLVRTIIFDRKCRNIFLIFFFYPIYIIFFSKIEIFMVKYFNLIFHKSQIREIE